MTDQQTPISYYLQTGYYLCLEQPLLDVVPEGGDDPLVPGHDVRDVDEGGGHGADLGHPQPGHLGLVPGQHQVHRQEGGHRVPHQLISGASILMGKSKYLEYLICYPFQMFKNLLSVLKKSFNHFLPF